MARGNSPQERQPQQLERKAARRAPYERILIVSEGSKTEPNYFKEIRAEYRLHTANGAKPPPVFSGGEPGSCVVFFREPFFSSRALGHWFGRRPNEVAAKRNGFAEGSERNPLATPLSLLLQEPVQPGDKVLAELLGMCIPRNKLGNELGEVVAQSEQLITNVTAYFTL